MGNLTSIVIGGHIFSLGKTKELSRETLEAEYGNKKVLGDKYVDKGKGHLKLSKKGIDSLHKQLTKALIDNGHMEKPKPKSSVPNK